MDNLWRINRMCPSVRKTSQKQSWPAKKFQCGSISKMFPLKIHNFS